MKPGRLEVITGPMFSGKSEELMRRLRRDKIAGKDVLLIKTKLDDRYADDFVVSHNGERMEATAADLAELRGLTREKDVVGIDEVQFYGEGIIDEIARLIGLHKKVIVSGLDMTYRREPFGCMPFLLSVAEDVTKLTAVCHSCGEDAYFTQRLSDGKPASFSGPTVEVGGSETYEARCRNCFQYSE